MLVAFFFNPKMCKGKGNSKIKVLGEFNIYNNDAATIGINKDQPPHSHSGFPKLSLLFFFFVCGERRLALVYY